MWFNLRASHSSHAIPNIAELVLDPLEAVSYTTFKLSFHCQHIIGLDSLLPFKLWIIWCRKSTSLITWSIEIIWVGPFTVSKFSVRTRVFRKWLAFLHHKKKSTLVSKKQPSFWSLSLHETWNVCITWRESCEVLRRKDLSHDHVWWHPMCDVGYIAASFWILRIMKVIGSVGSGTYL